MAASTMGRCQVARHGINSMSNGKFVASRPSQTIKHGLAAAPGCDCVTCSSARLLLGCQGLQEISSYLLSKQRQAAATCSSWRAAFLADGSLVTLRQQINFGWADSEKGWTIASAPRPCVHVAAALSFAAYLACCSGARSVRAARVAFRTQGRRQMTIAAAAEGESRTVQTSPHC